MYIRSYLVELVHSTSPRDLILKARMDTRGQEEQGATTKGNSLDAGTSAATDLLGNFGGNACARGSSSSDSTLCLRGGMNV